MESPPELPTVLGCTYFRKLYELGANRRVLDVAIMVS
jgi:hypothetical protein